MRIGRYRTRFGQATVEYLLTTMILVTIFAALYGFLHGQVKDMFIVAGTRILISYPIN